VSDEHALAAVIVTPEGPRFEGAASGVVLRTSDGDLTVLAGHTPLVGDVVPSVVRVLGEDGSTEGFVVHGGFVEVVTAPGAAAGVLEAPAADRTTRVTVLAGVAEALGELDVARATEAKARAEAVLAASEAGDEPEVVLVREEAAGALARATLRLEATADQ